MVLEAGADQSPQESQEASTRDSVFLGGAEVVGAFFWGERVFLGGEEVFFACVGEGSAWGEVVNHFLVSYFIRRWRSFMSRDSDLEGFWVSEAP